MHGTVKLSSRIGVRLTDELRAELSAAAREDGRTISSVAKRVLADWAAGRVVQRHEANEPAEVRK